MRRGFSMVELLIVLAIAAAVAAASLAYYSRSSEQTDTTDVVSLVRQVAREVRETFGSQPTLYSGLTMDALANAGTVERKRMMNAFFYSLPGNARMRVFPVTRGGITNGGFQIAIYSAPKALCYGVVMQTPADVATSIAINGATVGDALVNDAVTAAEAGTSCLAANNTILLSGA